MGGLNPPFASMHYLFITKLQNFRVLGRHDIFGYGINSLISPRVRLNFRG